MKSFVHPKLRRKTREWEFLWYGNTIHYEIGKTLSDKIVFWSKPHTYTEQELLALWFEEVVEEKKQDWKLDLYESLEWLFGKWLDELEEFLAFRKKLEKHMPKQKKFTGNDVHEHSMKTYGSDSGFYVNFTLNFLRDHDLLEE